MSAEAIGLLPPLLKATSDQIIVMEDMDYWGKRIIDVLGDLGQKTLRVENADQAVQLAQESSGRFYILDIDMGDGRGQEGLNALERLKTVEEEIGKKIFVAIYSAYPSRYQNYASKLADILVKKSDIDNISNDMEKIVSKMGLPSRVVDYLSKYKLRPGSQDPDPNDGKKFKIIHDESVRSDVNYQAFQEFISDENNLEKYLGQYVAFVDGEKIDSDKDLQPLITRLRQEYPNEHRFYSKVERKKRIEYVSSPLLLRDN